MKTIPIPSLLLLTSLPSLALAQNQPQVQYGAATVSLADQFHRLDNNDRELAAEITAVGRRVDVLEGASSPSNPVGGTTRYRVRQGDTITRIASNFGLNVEKVRLANGGSTTLYVDQVLTLPTRAGGSTAPVVDGDPGPIGNFVNYRVVRGDTLSRIARQHGTTVSSILSANGLSNENRIQVNQRLKIPVIGTGPVTTPTVVQGTQDYRVRPGDTLSRIARSHRVDVNELARMNRLSNLDRLSVGQVLLVPRTSGARVGYAAVSTAADAPIRSSQAVAPRREMTSAPLPPQRPVPFNYDGVLLSYKILPSDTLETVAQTFMTTPEILAGINGIPTTRRPATGTTLLVPKPSYLDQNGFTS